MASCNELVYNRGFDRHATKTIPATIRLISACRTDEAAHGNRQSGAFSRALLKAIQEPTDRMLRWKDVVMTMRDQLQRLGLPQVPQLTSSRFIDMDEEMSIVGEQQEQQSPGGTKRALLIGVQSYVDQENYDAVQGAHNDVKNMKQYLQDSQGFLEENIFVLMDDGEHKDPSFSMIISQFTNITHNSQPGDTVVCHFSGHGERTKENGECILPMDAESSGLRWITNELLYKNLVLRLQHGVTMTFIMDCCHSGDMLNLPYRFLGDGIMDKMARNKTVLSAIAGVGVIGITFTGLSVHCDDQDDGCCPGGNDDGGCCCCCCCCGEDN